MNDGKWTEATINEEAPEVLEFDEAVANSGATQTRRVLEDIARARAESDESQGYFRDYTDTDTSAQMLWSEQRQVEVEAQARSGRRPWISQLMLSVGLVALLLRPRNPYVGRTVQLRRLLLQVSEVCVAWVEALDARDSEKRVARMLAPSRWVRLLRWIRRGKS